MSSAPPEASVSITSAPESAEVTKKTATSAIASVEVAVWPDVKVVSALTPPADVTDAAIAIPSRGSQPGLAVLEVKTQLAAHADAAERTIHFTFGGGRSSVVRAARDLLSGIKVVDADTHVSEWYDLWTSRAPAKYRDRVPRVKKTDDGRMLWTIDDDKSLGINFCTCGRHEGGHMHPETLDAMDYLYANDPVMLGTCTFCFYHMIEYGVRNPGIVCISGAGDREVGLAGRVRHQMHVKIGGQAGRAGAGGGGSRRTHSGIVSLLKDGSRPGDGWGPSGRFSP